ncbi:PREDICTED: 28S ribosomal protein S23, mitochondrial [Nanorana parkeri]|uniref:28S ribosomal protein S23, mitochondrial n=1 Tax=Nanorana parkeri TaxID=125878 RepID=UPI000854497B|nr:PREDICTED: 28S ribosomal protein S23, mitochondrial [Nanorana parkeri]
MAGSRLEKLGTVFTRTRDLIRAGVKKQNEKPIWFDVYAAFPPKREPTYVSPPKRRLKPVDNVPAIFYREDVIKAKFYDTYGSPGMIYLYGKERKSICQRFVEKYLELQKSGVVGEKKLFEETGKALLVEGITLRRPGVSAAVYRPEDSKEYSICAAEEEKRFSDHSSREPARGGLDGSCQRLSLDTHTRNGVSFVMKMLEFEN